MLTPSILKTATGQVEIYSGGSGPLVVLLPSLGRGAADFLQLGDKLVALGYRVAAPEPRGIGKSEGPFENITFHDLAQDVADVIKANGGKAVIAGHAFGQKVGRTVAMDHPEMVRCVIMLAGAGRAIIPPEVRKAIMASGDPTLSDAERIAALKLAFFAPGNDPVAAGWLKGWHPEIKKVQLAAEGKTKDDEFIPAGRAPILDMQAEFDNVVPLSARQDLKNELGERVTIQVIANAGHALIPEQVDAVAAGIDAYAKKLPA
ncbi:MAG TPA: alpha/beta fold hydrolase [Reyranella sp.]